MFVYDTLDTKSYIFRTVSQSGQDVCGSNPMNGGMNIGLMQTDALHEVSGSGWENNELLNNEFLFAEELGLC